MKLLIPAIFALFSFAQAYAAESSASTKSIKGSSFTTTKLDTSSLKNKNSNGKTFNVETDLLRNANDITNIKLRYKVADQIALGVGFYDYDLKFTEKNAAVNGKTYSGEMMYFIGAPAFSDSSFLRAELGYTSLELNSDLIRGSITFNGVSISGKASGIQAYLDYGYNWQWSVISLNTYIGFQYYNLSAEANTTVGSGDAATVSGTALDTGVQLGVSF